LHIAGGASVLSHAAVGTLSVEKLLILPFLKLLNKFRKRCKLTRVNQIELVDEIYKMLEACIQMRLCRQKHYVLEMRVVDVGVNSK
jgi:hypothetical protein